MTFFKNLVRTPFVFGVLVLFVMLFVSQNAFGASTIQGTVYDRQRNILSEIEVELLNEYYQTINRARTDGSGRYQFNGLRDGRYTVRVFAFRYDLEDQEQPVEIITQTVRGTEGTGFFLADFYLLPKKGGLADAEIGVIFAQDIPPDAKKMYEKALKDLSDKRTNEGLLGLNEAVKNFPNYYLALHRVGRELFILKRYTEAVPFLLKAAEVNNKSTTSFYYLGYSLHNLGKEYNKAAIRCLNNALVLAPSSTQVMFVLGKIERSDGKYNDAEKHLLQAKKLSKVAVPEIHKELAQLYADDMKKYKEAADELELYLKASKLDNSAAAQTKKVISNLREKAKSQVANN
ncbi:MAG: carboxypeptidase regulatory-like domain-containing protein [Acidobacteriota bacterium]|nr:carboxypeptidase regulatory-like domain-containing protein [Acidobacteriota bacterium]